MPAAHSLLREAARAWVLCTGGRHTAQNSWQWCSCASRAAARLQARPLHARRGVRRGQRRGRVHAAAALRARARLQLLRQRGGLAAQQAHAAAGAQRICQRLLQLGRQLDQAQRAPADQLRHLRRHLAQAALRVPLKQL